MPNSLFSGTNRLICDALHIESRQNLRRKTQKLALLSEDEAFSLVQQLYRTIDDNFPGYARHPSDQLWRSTQETHICERNHSSEKMLEKAVAMLSKRKHMPGWFNQCPVATGLTDPHADAKRSVDLIHLSTNTLRLIELKWNSGDTPALALFEILEYGLAYLLARQYKHKLNLLQRDFMQSTLQRVHLEVVAPVKFFKGASYCNLFSALHRAIAKFTEGETKGEWSMSLGIAAFPDWFHEVPFESGGEVKQICASPSLTEKGRMVQHAFASLVSPPTSSEE